MSGPPANPLSTSATRYVLDVPNSRFTVQAFAAGFLAAFAHSPTFAVRDFSGEFRFSPDGAGQSSFEMTVQAQSLQLTDDVKESDRQEIQKTALDDVLEVGKFPQISFRSAQIVITKITEAWYRAEIRGDMRLHGATRPLSIDTQVRLAERAMRVSGEFTIKFPDYQIKRVTGLAGLIKIKDELKFSFDLSGRQEPEA